MGYYIDDYLGKLQENIDGGDVQIADKEAVTELISEIRSILNIDACMRSSQAEWLRERLLKYSEGNLGLRKDIKNRVERFRLKCEHCLDSKCLHRESAVQLVPKVANNNQSVYKPQSENRDESIRISEFETLDTEICNIEISTSKAFSEAGICTYQELAGLDRFDLMAMEIPGYDIVAVENALLKRGFSFAKKEEGVGVWAILVEDAGFSGRTLSRLKCSKVKTLGNICRIGERGLLSIGAFGSKSVEEVRIVLSKYGLELEKSSA